MNKRKEINVRSVAKKWNQKVHVTKTRNLISRSSPNFKRYWCRVEKLNTYEEQVRLCGKEELYSASME